MTDTLPAVTEPDADAARGEGGRGTRWLDDRRARGAANVIAAVFALYWIVDKLWPAPGGVFLRGLVIGGLYALVALGIALIYRANRFINFAQADMGGAPGALAVLLIAGPGLPWAAAMVCGLGAGAVIGLLIAGLYLLPPLQKAPRVVLSVVSIALASLLAGIEIVLPQAFGIKLPPQTFASPFNFSFTFRHVVFQGNDVLAMVAVPVAMAALAWFLNRTHIGVAVRAVAESSDRAALLGVPVKRVNLVVWVVAAELATVALILRAGVVGLPLGQALGWQLLLPVLAAAVIGRLERMPTIVAASLLFGVVEQAVVWHTGKGELVDLVLFLVIVAVLVVQKSGLTSRVEVSSWSSWANQLEVRPIPPELVNLPEVVWARRTLLAVVAVVAVVAPSLLGEAKTDLAITLLIFMIVGLSLLVLFGWAGQISLGQFAFVGVGSATGAWMSLHWQVDITIELVLAGLVGALVAIVIGIPALRIRGLYLAVVTLGFTLACGSYFLSYTHFHWIPSQDQSVQRRALFGRVQIASETQYYFFCLVVLLVCIAAVRGLQRSRLRRVLVGYRENERGVQAFGVNVVAAKLTAFAISGFLASVAGVLLVHLQFALYPGTINPDQSVSAFVMVVIGGPGSMLGALAGATYLNALSWAQSWAPHALRAVLQLLGSGIGLILILIFLPGGVASLFYRGRDSLLRRLADRRGIIVPSLVADRRDDAERGVRAPAAADPAFATGVHLDLDDRPRAEPVSGVRS